VIENATPEGFDLWVYPRTPPGAHSVFGDPVSLRGGELLAVAAAGPRWLVTGEWLAEDTQRVATVEPT
jgi:hypothetical protein